MLPIACKVRMHTRVCIFIKSTGGNRDACAYHVRARMSSIRVIVAPDVYFKSPSRRYKFHCYIFGRVMNGCSINSVVNEWWGCETEDAICDKGSLTLYTILFSKLIFNLLDTLIISWGWKGRNEQNHDLWTTVIFRNLHRIRVTK